MSLWFTPSEGGEEPLGPPQDPPPAESELGGGAQPGGLTDAHLMGGGGRTPGTPRMPQDPSGPPQRHPGPPTQDALWPPQPPLWSRCWGGWVVALESRGGGRVGPPPDAWSAMGVVNKRCPAPRRTALPYWAGGRGTEGRSRRWGRSCRFGKVSSLGAGRC